MGTTEGIGKAHPRKNHPLVRVSQTTVNSVRLDVGNQSAFLSPAEALDLHDRLTRILVLRGLLEAQS